jgi:hypothetical protein
LQRCIVADPEFREKWVVAYKEGETACERLGASHLLWHGLWAFKVGAEGERTDLVMGDRIDNPGAAVTTGSGLVLTEWKRARTRGEADGMSSEGKGQASRYARGVLAGVELASPRYVVVVTEDLTELPQDVIEGDVAYRFVNIAVRPSPPAEAARKARRSARDRE